MKLLGICNRIIEYSFYALFLLTPLALSKDTSELFELNKMWLVWAITIIIAASWLIKMVLQRRILFQRTPLDIPIGLFLLSQIISTIFSLDPHTSLWGYYSRFNGGLLSIISYILLYYAYLSNLSGLSYLKRILSLSLISGLIVALWGLPSHFGYDPTCLLFRGTFDVSCWTADFLPKVRIFSTLGQPDWLAAYLAILIPISFVYVLGNWKLEIRNWKLWTYSSIAVLFYVDVLYTLARSGFLGVWISLAFFLLTYVWIETKNKKSFIVYVLLFGFLGTWIAALVQRKNLKSLIINPLSLIIGLLLFITFVIGAPISQLRGLTLKGMINFFEKIHVPKTSGAPETIPTPTQSAESGGSESGDIRLLVWEGAINAWKSNPIFGTGVETFAFAYYKYKPVGQNLTSEWDYLYNKAHNEYLNYLATTGIVGLGSYLLMIGSFLFLVIRKISKSEFLISNQIPNSKSQLGQLEIRSIRNLSLALLASYVSILITNFFGFSVVITNVYLFMIPAFVFVLTGLIKTETSDKQQEISRLSPTVLTCIFLILITCLFLLISLFRFWQADIAYAFGFNLDRAGEYQQAYPNLHKAVQLRGDEPVFKDELALNDAFVAVGLASQKPPDQNTKEQTINIASALAQEAINTSNEVISQYQNNAVFWKNRTRLFVELSQADSRYLSRALDAIEKASLLAPNDARIWYNLGVLYGQNNNLDKGISVMEKVIMLKPNYREAHYALGLFYHAASLDKSGKIVIDENFNQKAIAQMQFILDNISPNDAAALKSLSDWAK